MKTRKTKGYTLIEMLLVIGFVALASVGVYNIYNKAKIMSIVNQEVKVLSSFTKDITEMYSSDSSYMGLDNITLNTARVTPVEMRDSTNINNIINRFGGNVTVSSENYGAMVDTAFKINYDGLHPDYCTAMIMAISPQFDQVEVNGVFVKWFNNTIATPANVSTACNSNGNNPANVSFHVVTTFKSAMAAPIPPMAPAPGTQFKMLPSDAICDFNSPGFNAGNPAITNDIRNRIIFTIKTIDNYAGRCIVAPAFSQIMTDIDNYKLSNPNMSYSDIYTNIEEPIVLSTGYLASKGASISAADTACTNASVSVYGVAVPSSYVLYSGNKCKVN